MIMPRRCRLRRLILLAIRHQPVMIRGVTRGIGGLALLLAVALAGCGGGEAAAVKASEPCGSGAGARPADLSALRASVAYQGDVGSLPQHVVDVLPGHRGDVSDSAVVGVVSSVTRRNAVGEEPPATEAGGGPPVLEFDDPDAVGGRNLAVTINVDETLAGPHLAAVTVPWWLPGTSQHGLDANAVCRALLHTGRVVVFSHATPEHAAGWYGFDRVMIGTPYTFATLDANERLHFPLLGHGRIGDPSETEYLGRVTTLPALREVATAAR